MYSDRLDYSCRFVSTGLKLFVQSNSIFASATFLAFVVMGAICGAVLLGLIPISADMYEPENIPECSAV